MGKEIREPNVVVAISNHVGLIFIFLAEKHVGLMIRWFPVA
jgi:hypothetical protein